MVVRPWIESLSPRSVKVFKTIAVLLKAKRNQQHAADLDRRSQKHEAAHGEQLRHRKFDADGEEQQHDPDLGQHFDRADIRDEVQPVGADDGAGDQKSRDGGKPELMEYEDDSNRRREDY